MRRQQQIAEAKKLLRHLDQRTPCPPRGAELPRVQAIDIGYCSGRARHWPLRRAEQSLA